MPVASATCHFRATYIHVLEPNLAFHKTKKIKNKEGKPSHTALNVLNKKFKRMMEFVSTANVNVAAVTLLVTLVALLFARTTTTFNKEKQAHTPSESAVLITGGSRGIGRSIANHLSQKGFVVLVTIRTQKQYDELEKDRQAKGGPYPIMMDVTNDSHVEPAVQSVKAVLKEKNVELVAIVNNAGE